MQNIKKSLVTYKNKTIGMSELQVLMKPFLDTYEAFSHAILELENEGILSMVKSKGRTTRTPSLALQYRIHKSLLTEDYHTELQQYRSKLHSAINLDWYYGKDPSIWKEDLPAIIKIDAYLQAHAFPQDVVPAPERSYELMQDEKWVVEKGGKELLERIGLFHAFQIIPVSEPLMFAINPLKINKNHQYHLIVENKTTYQGLLPALMETNFATLIYGSGKTIISSIDQFFMQYPVNKEHHFFYFGDLDKEGISIWYSLHNKQPTALATPFYQACLQQKPATGKAYQRERAEALEQFLTFFSENEQTQMKALLAGGEYYPQETLKTNTLQNIWREANWTALI